MSCQIPRAIFLFQFYFRLAQKRSNYYCLDVLFLIALAANRLQMQVIGASLGSKGLKLGLKMANPMFFSISGN